jgi:hypothetical protein
MARKTSGSSSTVNNMGFAMIDFRLKFDLKMKGIPEI